MRSLKRMRAAVAAVLVLGAGPALAQSAPGWREAAAEAREAGDPERLVQVLSTAAEAGSTQARSQLGDIYRAGELVPQNLRLAARWYREAGRGDGHALNMLGRMYFEGLGVDQDRDEAIALLHQAAALGTPAHVHDYAAALEMRDEPGDVEEAAGWYRDAADAGHAPALTSLGVLHLEGRGVGLISGGRAPCLNRPLRPATPGVRTISVCSMSAAMGLIRTMSAPPRCFRPPPIRIWPRP